MSGRASLFFQAGEFSDAAKTYETVLERISKDTERDRYMTAVQAKEYGLVDEVVGHIPSAEAAKGNT